jgi:hypothetical protein
MKHFPDLLMLIIATILSIQACDKPRSEYKQQALAYFYGEEMAGSRAAGMMISSYGEKIKRYCNRT